MNEKIRVEPKAFERMFPTTVEKSSVVKKLEKEARDLKESIEKTNDSRNTSFAQLKYAKLISRIEEIKNPNSLMLLRYE